MAERYGNKKVNMAEYQAPKALVIFAQGVFLFGSLLVISLSLWLIIFIWDKILELI